uniref:Growth hormone receptor a n=1 Tax=Salarias fasciatus TaxID=181472 RepID=A0A672JK52_SALFA
MKRNCIRRLIDQLNAVRVSLSVVSPNLNPVSRCLSAPAGPHFIDCSSRDQATFRCRWSPGTFHNLSSPGALRVFYLKKEKPTSEWRECPEYNYSTRECFFDQNYTSIWITYCVQLRSQDNVTYFNEDDCFVVENIVRPDPPVSLNWTLLNLSPSGLSYDVMVNWEPPPSADVPLGWMRVEYEMQYREKNTTNWEAVSSPHTRQTIYGLHIGKEYEVHIRSKMPGFTKFGEFSDHRVYFLCKCQISPNTDGQHVTYIMLSYLYRLMMAMLPPVPAPKIKGIDSELLKKGKLDELNFILSGGGVGGLPHYAPDFYQDEPWVEFIEVDAEDADGGEKEDNQGSDTQRLLSLPQPKSSFLDFCPSFSASYPDEDSGLASCYDPALSEQASLILMATLLPGQAEDEEGSIDFVEAAPATERGEGAFVQAHGGAQQTWVNTDFYAQVSNVMPSGGVVLSPGQQLKIQESAANTEEKAQKKGKGGEDDNDTRERKQKELQFQLVVVDPEGSGYTTESNIQPISTPPSSHVPGEGYQTIHPQPAEARPAATAEENQSPYILPDSPESQFFAPVADYTVVQELDSHSLLLNPPPHQSPPPCMPQHPLKSPMPVGYITPDLLGNLSP